MNIDFIEDEYLEHYGVPGMKWGVRKSYNGMPSSVYSKVSKGSGGSVTKSDATRSYNGMPSNLQGKVGSKTIKKKAKKAVSSILGTSSGKKGKSGKSAAQKAKEKAEKEAAKKKKQEEAAAKKAASAAKKSEAVSKKSTEADLRKQLADAKKKLAEAQNRKTVNIDESYIEYLEKKLGNHNAGSRMGKIYRRSGLRHDDLNSIDASVMIFSNEFNKPLIDEDFLEHHGILGQKWGKKNGPPYPLDEGDHSAKEKKDGYKKSLGGGRNEKLYDRHKKEIKEAAKQEVTKQKIDNHRKEMIAYYNKKGDKSGAEVYKKATDEQIKTEIQHREAIKKALIISGAAVGIGVAAYVIYSRKSLHDFNVVKDALVNGGLDKVDANTLIKQGLSIDTANKIITLDAKKRIISDKDIFEAIKNGVLDDMDLTIKNARFQRMDFNPNFDISKVKNPLFVGLGKEDIDKYYNGFVGGMIPNRSGKGKDSEVFQLTLDALEDIKIPSREKTKSIYADIMKLDPSFDDDLRAAVQGMIDKNAKIMGRQALKLTPKEWESWKEQLDLPKRITIFGNLGGYGDAGTAEYLPNMVMGANGVAKEKISKAFKDRGFNAMIDMHDVLDEVSDLPVILLNNNLEVVKKTKHFVI